MCFGRPMNKNPRPFVSYLICRIKAGSAASSHKRTRRLAQEIVSLNSSLPLSLSSSVFIRASEERLDAMKVDSKN